MRIGILTFHRAHNYGAVLQCYALQTFLTDLGHEAEVIDYNNQKLWGFYNWRDKIYEKAILRNPIKFPIRLIRYLWGRRYQRSRYQKFIYFQEKIIRLSDVDKITNNPYDLILIGSDQVWNPLITGGYDKYYWGYFEHPAKTKIATYAASLRGEWNRSDYDKIYGYLNNLQGISVRENSLYNYLNKIFPKLSVSCVPDPVLLLSSESWKKLASLPSINVPYAFFYQAETKEHVYNSAKEIAAKAGLPLYSLSADQWSVNSKECHSASPQEFIGWILNAKLVITSSFHALAFCILFNKDFYVINLNSGKDERLRNLVKMFDLDYRLIDNVHDCITLKPFSTDNVLSKMKKNAITYIKGLGI